MTLTNLQNKYNQLQGKKDYLEKEIKVLEMKIVKGRRQVTLLEKAIAFVQEIGLKTQQQLQFHISDIVSVALHSVFNEPYTFEAQFEQRRSKTECHLLFERGGSRVSPIDAAGGGAVDVASFALRVVSYCLKPNRKVLILDEPFRYLSRDLQSNAGEVLKKLSNDLNLQIIMVTHEEQLMDFGDKIFKVSQKKGISKVEEVK